MVVIATDQEFLLSIIHITLNPERVMITKCARPKVHSVNFVVRNTGFK